MTIQNIRDWAKASYSIHRGAEVIEECMSDIDIQKEIDTDFGGMGFKEWVKLMAEVEI